MPLQLLLLTVIHSRSNLLDFQLLPVIPFIITLFKISPPQICLDITIKKHPIVHIGLALPAISNFCKPNPRGWVGN